jgi:hypothetical protein
VCDGFAAVNLQEVKICKEQIIASRETSCELELDFQCKIVTYLDLFVCIAAQRQPGSGVK